MNLTIWDFTGFTGLNSGEGLIIRVVFEKDSTVFL